MLKRHVLISVIWMAVLVLCSLPAFAQETLWSRTYRGSDMDEGWSVQQTADGGYVVAGYSFSGGLEDVYVVKTDSLGEILWSRVYGGLEFNTGTCVQQTADEGYVVTSSFGVDPRSVMLTKLNAFGKACVGEFVTSTTMSVPCSVTNPPTEVTSPTTIVTSPQTQVMIPATDVTTVCMRVCGDVSGDGIVDVGDVVYLINYLYRGDDPPDPLEAGDVNCDGITDIGDVVYLIGYLYKGGPPPCC